MNFAEAVRRCVDTMGAGVVRDPRRFVSCLLDFADDSLALRAAARNLDDGALAPFVEALDAGDDADSLDLAAAKVEVTLRNERGLEASVAHDIASAISEALSGVLAPPSRQEADAQDVPTPQPEPKPGSQEDAPYDRVGAQTVVDNDESAPAKSGFPSRTSLLNLAAGLSLLSVIVNGLFIRLYGYDSVGLPITVVVADAAFAVCAFKRPRGFEKMLVAVAAYHFALFCNMIIQSASYLSLAYFSPLALLSFGATACLYVAFCVALIGPQRFKKAAAVVATISAVIVIMQGLSSLAYALGGVTTLSALVNNLAGILLYATFAIASWAMVAPRRMTTGEMAGRSRA